MSYSPNNPNGNATAANSAPVTLASDNNGPVKVWDGTNTGSVLSGDSGNNAQVIASARKEVSFTTTTIQAVASTDVSNYRAVSVHITSQGAGSTVTFQVSNDNINWPSTILTNNGAGTTQATQASNTTSSGVIYSGAITARYFRLNVTGIASGTTAGVIEFFALAPAPTSMTITNTSGSNVGVAASQSGTWNVGINNGLMPSGTALNTYSVHITTNATTTPTASTAYISAIAISNEVGGTTSTITIQDKQGTPLKLVNGIATTALTTAPTIINFQTPVKMVSGIDVITAGSVAATVDVWIDYYQ